MEKPAQPIIIQTSGSSGGKNLLPSFPLERLPGVVFIILSLIIVGELIWGVYYLTRPRPQTPTQKNLNLSFLPEKSSVEIALVSPDTNVNVGDNVLVDIVVSGNVPDVVGVDLVLKYDKDFLSLEGSSLATFIRGSLFSEYLGESKQTTDGVFRISGITSSPIPSIKGGKKFGSLNFKAVKSGLAKIQIDFIKGGTVDTNVLNEDADGDVLDKVTNLEVKIN